MCGIFGWVLPAAMRQDETLLRALTDKLAHRGPNGSGSWLAITADQSHQIGFGHRRLAILDLSEAGAQPMTSSTGHLTVTYNGEIYNYLELRDELAARGHVFVTGTDTEVLLKAYQEWGGECIDRLRGMFAFALWDADRQQLLFARDAFGKKPLYICEWDGGVLFSSEIAPLLAFPGMQRQCNTAMLPHYLFNRYVPGPQTFFQHINKLAPGSVAVWKKGTITTRRYFTPPTPGMDKPIRSFPEAIERFSDVFDKAVAIRMRSDAPFGAFLSGGVDSSAVVAAMVKHSSSPIRTFCAGFRGHRYSEIDAARDISRHFGTRHEELLVEPEMFFAELESATEHRGAPVSEHADLIISMLSRVASNSVRMVLTGEGSDELLGGYPKYRAEPFVSTIMPFLFKAPFLAGLSSLLPYGMHRTRVVLQAMGEADASERMRVWFGGLSSRDCMSLLGRPASLAPPEALPFSAHTGSRFRDMLFFDQTSWLPDDLLERGDRMMMMGSIEGRMPFMDVELARLVARFPDHFLMGKGQSKRVLREAMSRTLPRWVLARRKIGFRVPVDEWFRALYQPVLRELLQSESSRVARVLDVASISRMLAEHENLQRNHARTLWSLISLEIFLRRFDLDLKSIA